MNPRQRRGALLLVITSLGVIAVFFAVVVFVGDVSSRVGPMTSVLQLTRPVSAYEPVEPAHFKEVEVPQRWLPETAVTDVESTVGLVAATDLPEGSMLQEGMLIPRPGVQPGYREIAIVVDAETGVAGKVRPGDHVDILATINGDDERAARSEIWVSNVLVLEVGLPQELAGSDEQKRARVREQANPALAGRWEDELPVGAERALSVEHPLPLRPALGQMRGNR